MLLSSSNFRLSIRSLFLVAVMAALGSPARGADEPVSLFDGKTLKGWDVLTCEVEVQDGAILLKGGNGLVQTKKQYADFVFTCEWKALKPDAWDSGIYFRYTEVPEGRPWPQKYQVNMRKGMEGDLVSAQQQEPGRGQAWRVEQIRIDGEGIHGVAAGQWQAVLEIGRHRGGQGFHRSAGGDPRRRPVSVPSNHNPRVAGITGNRYFSSIQQR